MAVQRLVITVVCKRCGYVFYRGEKVPNLFRIYASVGGRCPRCGREIGWVPLNVKVERRRARG